MRVICKLCGEACVETEVEYFYNNSISYSIGFECENPDCENDEICDMSELGKNFIIDDEE